MLRNRTATLRRRATRCISIITCLGVIVSALVMTPFTSATKRPSLLAQGQNPISNGNARKVSPPAPDKSPGIHGLPSLSELRRTSLPAPAAPAPIPSLMRSRHKPLQSLHGKKVGDPGTTGGPVVKIRTGKPRASVSGRAHHAKAKPVSAPPPLPDDQYIGNFVYYALGRGISSTELTYWTDIARAAYAQGPNSMLVAMRQLGRTVFESADYAARPARDCSNLDNAHNYVLDLYQSYLMTYPDQGGWDFWAGQCYANGKEQVRAAFDQSSAFYNNVTSLTPDGSISSYVGSVSSARVDPFNQTGNQTEARDCEWNLPLLSLPGRAGLDLGLGLSYSSLVWTPSGPYLYFDEDHGSPSPGFRLGFATVQWLAFDPQSQRNVYMVVTASGKHIALRQVGSSNTYEAADSSYLQLTDNGSYLVLRTTDGTQITYSSYANEWCATQVKDRNGNYLTINNDWRGDIQTITDTLNRTIYFFYDSNANISSIAQIWNGNWHYWATFGFGSNLSINVSQFSGTSVVGTSTGEQIAVLREVGLADGTYYTFDYSAVGQVTNIHHYRSDNYSDNYTAYDYGSDQRSYAGTNYYDCPRIYDARIWAASWTGYYGVPSEVITQFNLPGDGSHQMITPDGTVYRDYYGSGWQNGLVTDARVYTSAGLQRQTTTSYTQDNTSVNYQTNPRVTETNVYDAPPYYNHRRTTIDYQSSFGLPSVVTEYDADAANVIRRTYFDYVNDSPYTDRRIIGLPFRHRVYDGNWAMLSKTEYYYDWGAEHMQNTPAVPIQHDSSYDVNFLVRGNLIDVAQFDVTDPNNNSGTLHEFKKGFDIAGNVTFTRDPLWHQSFISYGDSFSDSSNQNAFAYPTTVTDADGYSTYVQYNYAFGARTQVQTPQPNTTSNTPGPIQTFTYDGAGRPYQVTTQATGAYVHYFYGSYYSYTLSTTNYVGDEAYAVQIFDGLGRVTQAATNNPGSAGGYKATWTQFDAMGQVMKQYNPTEIDGYWNVYGDDVGGASYTQQTYDWKGRPLITTNQDGTQKYISYAGCGCAGGEIATLTDEVGRQQRVYSDVLGRQWKKEVLNGNGSVYSTTTTTLNGNDQVTNVRVTDNATGGYHDTTMSFDGYGRLSFQHMPEQQVDPNNPASTDHTSWVYNSDNTIYSVTDARGAVSTFAYNGRHLVSGITYSVLPGVPTTWPGFPVLPTPAESFHYDAAGNRTSMTDGSGSTSYQYDQLSRITSETKQINGLPGSYTISYDYNLANEVTRVTDPNNDTIYYSYDQTGRLTSVTGSQWGGVTTYASGFQYRAWGAVKAMGYGNGLALTTSYDSVLRPLSSQIQDPTTGPTTLKRNNYQYYADGSLRYAQDVVDDHFDRAASYDQVGRVKEGYSGSEARAFINNQPAPSTDLGPYRQSLDFNAWDDPTVSNERYWSKQFDPHTRTFVNSRNQDPAWLYDAQGHLLLTEEMSFVYDNASRAVRVGGKPCTYDGDGEEVKKDESGGSGLPNIYYIRSTVLGGNIIDEATNYNGGNTSFLSYVYLGSQLLATRQGTAQQGTVYFAHQDPVTHSTAGSGLGAWYVRNVELDATGVDVGIQDPFLNSNPGPDEAPQYAVVYTASDWGNGELVPECWMDGMPENCEVAQEEINAGAAAPCPDHSCGPRGIPYIDENGQMGNAGWLLFNGDGFWASDGTESGYLDPDDVRFGSALDAYAMSFAQSRQKRTHRSRRARGRRQIGIDATGGVVGVSLPVRIEDFDQTQENQIKSALEKLFTDKCAEAYKAAGLKTPMEVAQQGVVFRPSTDLINSSADQLGLVNDTIRQAYREQFFGNTASSSAQGGTIPAVRNGVKLTTDGSTQIYLDRYWAFVGESYIDRTFSLQDLMSHEFIHGGGQPPTPGYFGRWRHDLAGFDPHDKILEACR